MKKIIIGIMVGLIISCTVGVLAASIVPSTIVTYQDKTVNNALDELYDSVNLLKTKGDAKASQILTGKKVIVKGTEITGTMANRGNLNWSPSSSTTYTVPAGYYSGGTLNSSGSYKAGYSAGVTAADNRANINSTNYKTGYNSGYGAGLNAGSTYSYVYQNSGNFSTGYNYSTTLSAGTYLVIVYGNRGQNGITSANYPGIGISGGNATLIASSEVAVIGRAYSNISTRIYTYKVTSNSAFVLTATVNNLTQEDYNGSTSGVQVIKVG